MGLKPVYAIYADDKNITDLFKDRLIDLSITDEDGFKSDTLSISIIDDGVEIPKKGIKLSVQIGYDDVLDDMGFFIVDSVDISIAPDIMKISAKGVPLDSNSKTYKTLQTSKNRSFPTQSLKQLVERIANDNKLKFSISKSLTDVVLDHIVQSSESDMNLLTRIAKKYDALFKISTGHIIITKRGDGLSSSGKDLPKINLKQSQIKSLNYSTGSQSEFKKVTASYRDVKKGKDIIVSAGAGEPVKKLKEVFNNEQSALNAVKSALNRYGRDAVTVDIATIGNTSIRAGSPLELSEFRQGINGNYIIKSCTHNISSSGYSTDLTAEPIYR